MGNLCITADQLQRALWVQGEVYQVGDEAVGAVREAEVRAVCCSAGVLLLRAHEQGNVRLAVRAPVLQCAPQKDVRSGPWKGKVVRKEGMCERRVHRNLHV